MSHPSWVRGLKQKNPFWMRSSLVAPLVGAWIETLACQEPSRINIMSHPSWVRGLKLRLAVVIVIGNCRTPRGCVD